MNLRMIHEAISLTLLITGMFHGQQIGTAQNEVPDEPGTAIEPPGEWGGVGESRCTGGKLHEKEHRTL